MELPSIVDLARSAAGPAVAARLQRDMKAATAWKIQQQVNKKKVLPTLKHPLLQEDEFENKQQRDTYRAAAYKAISSHGRNSEIVKFLPKASVELRPSPIHGMGVFATKDIEAFSFLSLYPCDGLLWLPEDADWDLINSTAAIRTGWKPTSLEEELTYRQAIDSLGRGKLFIDANPSVTADPYFLAHMINDGASCKREESAEMYWTISDRKRNSLFCPVLEAHFATKDIKKGEEILSTYGSDYWLDLATYCKKDSFNLMAMD